MSKPFISILYPTKDRESFLDFCFYTLSKSSFKDFEVILSDNSLNGNAFRIYNKYKTEINIRYFHTGGTFSMAENYGFAIKHATGEYVTCMTDKVSLKFKALEIIYNILKKHDLDMLNWMENGITIFDESKSLNISGYNETFFRPVLEHFNPNHVINYISSFAKHRTNDSENYYYGKIFFGCIKLSLINKYVELNNYFLIYSPDYTSRIINLAVASKCMFLKAPLQTSFSSKTSNGQNCAKIPNLLQKFLFQADKLVIYNKYAIFKELSYSVQNSISCDYIHGSVISNIVLKINERNLFITCMNDIFILEYQYCKEFVSQLIFLYNYSSQRKILSKMEFWRVSLKLLIFKMVKYIFVLIKHIYRSIVVRIPIIGKYRKHKLTVFNNMIDTIDSINKSFENILSAFHGFI